MGSESRSATFPASGGEVPTIEPDHSRLRLQIVGLVAMGALAHIGWEYFNGGIHAHHLFQRADMPAMSNAWGAVLLPAGRRLGSVSHAVLHHANCPVAIVPCVERATTAPQRAGDTD